jgi:SAM-dependent methyltransferase
VEDFYTTNAQRLFNQYNSLSPEAVHSAWLPYLPKLSNSISSKQALDIGAGSGRDTAWLAAEGWNVVAVEPALGLSRLGSDITRGQAVSWLDDSLPELASLVSSFDNSTDVSAGYDFILVSAVWMHLTPAEQVQSLLRLKQLAAPGAVLVITWRNQADEAERVFYPVDVEQFKTAQFEAGQFKLLAAYSSADEGGREGVVWQCVVLENEVCGFGK